MAKVTVTDTPFELGAGASVAAMNDDGLLFRSVVLGKISPLSIAGAITVAADSAFRPYVVSGILIGDTGSYMTTLTIQADASIRVDALASHADAFGYNAGSWMPRTLNAGTIEVQAKADAYGIRAGLTQDQGDIAVTNAGAIHAMSLEGKAYGVYMGAGDGFSNSGEIAASGSQGSIGVYFYQWDATFENSGTIKVAGEGSVAVYGNTTFRAPFHNSGLIQGDYALKFIDYNADLTALQPAPNIFENAGTMIGKVDLGHLRQVFTNSGTVMGDISLGPGDDTYTAANGVTDGLVSGGDGNDRLIGGAQFDNLQGNAGADTENGGGGNDWVVGGKDGDNLSGDDGDDLVYGNLGNDTCDGGAGNDIVRGGQDNDSLNGGAGDDFVSGDKGDDTEMGGAGADVFHTFGDGGIDRVLDFHLSEGDRVQLDPGTQYTVAQVGADTVISMTGGGQMILVGVSMSTLTGNWIFGA